MRGFGSLLNFHGSGKRRRSLMKKHNATPSSSLLRPIVQLNRWVTTGGCGGYDGSQGGSQVASYREGRGWGGETGQQITQG